GEVVRRAEGGPGTQANTVTGRQSKSHKPSTPTGRDAWTITEPPNRAYGTTGSTSTGHST
ncbi:MAG: hypothetical protein Q8Q52_04305, partial [Acidimicrobiia bacterium]|nr:hypothetical protein [Acidimicrobiia bacterium]